MAKFRLPALFAATMLSACAPAAEVPRTVSPALLDSVREGIVELTCRSSACENVWLARVEHAAHLTTQARWAELSQLLVVTNYSSDIGYYFLGRAADGLGSPSAAVHYYEIAKAELRSDQSCEAIGLCRGLGIPAVIEAERAAAQRKAAGSISGSRRAALP
jgi:hypothetical protein